MEPDSAWLAALNAKETPVPVHAFWAGRDEFVSPPDAARLPGAPETCAPLAGHLTVLAAAGSAQEDFGRLRACREARPGASAALNPQPEPPAPIVVVAPVEATPAIAETPVVVVAPPAAADQRHGRSAPAPAQEQPVAGA